MEHKFDEKLTCEGVVGDGCGGGRIFTVEESKLKVYDPQTKEIMILLDDVNNAESISKKGCLITIECEDKSIKFNLSIMSIV
ncbi:thiamine biosynthesis protein ThiF [Sulfurimonas sp.]|uniref:thiamine biosynthesis protein ThiF n=1 Tax=Sulfurimonas sp. TaxID=2022749 RepID=UPI0025F89397|nr:thiamine biosynthesis protein ThiF [Sulfurimonas sp.]MDD5158278.1 thiamine biosynthesis protein ThiF [Sulfurimonas sp.]